VGRERRVSTKFYCLLVFPLEKSFALPPTPGSNDHFVSNYESESWKIRFT
jgi:hypothetical protein